MTSSDVTRLRDGAIEELAGRVGTSLTGDEDGAGLRIGVVCGRFNGGITERLLVGALEALDEAGTASDDVTVAWVAGAFEVPLVARRLAVSGTVDAVVCLGAVIRGDTGHYDFVAGECASGIQRVQLDTGVPVIFGVLTTDTVDQALERSRSDATNKGRESALTAIETVRILSAIDGKG